MSNDRKIFYKALFLGWLLMLGFDLLVWRLVFAGLLHITVPFLIATIGNTVFLLVVSYKIEDRLIAKQSQ